MAAQKAARALQLMKDFASQRIGGQFFDRTAMSQAKIIDGGVGHVKCEIPVTAELLNGAGAVHGGAIATIVDGVSTWAAVSAGKNIPGVSIELSVSYIKAALPGETLLVEAQTSHMGGRLAFLTVDIKNKDTGALIAQGKHTKYMSSGSKPTKAGEPVS
ncbi:acyl-coenzyme A thioesterase 13-like [Babylonia areolata]|uniref:acyl-coenzyme A thioesterase 13-like n=1 Tax=Babylonia areolata TaxID=304850 RepID=UPI003FCF90D1